MIETLSILPLAFWAVVALLIGGGVWAVRHLRDTSGLPMLAVLGTVTAWYVGDAFYNDYANNHAKIFDDTVLQSAWWQVAWFLMVFLLSAPWLHQWINARHLRRGSGVYQMFKYGVGQPLFQRQLDLLFLVSVLAWLTVVVIATVRLQGHILFYLFPFLGEKAEPWGRARIGTGFDALWTMLGYLQMLVTAIFGVVAALATNRRIRWLALLCCLFTWPYFIFDRTRNTMLAVVIPGVLSWVFLRLRGNMLKRFVVLGGCFLVVNAWMGFVIANRSDMTIIEALKEKGFNLDTDEKVHHEGLNMYEELCWINTFIENGTYKPNWGARYFAELVNPIPRALWPGKPLIGIDYAIARGQAGGGANAAGVYATISTGMIGQGVVNFGRVIGPAFAALLMSFWVAILARLDLHIHELGRLPLYALGMILTFNLGRDITLITLYPFVFGYIAVRWLDRWHRSTLRTALQDQRYRRPVPGLNRQRIPLRRWQRRGKTSAVRIKVALQKRGLSHAPGTSRNHL
ncbi:MAG: hypothetical protein ACLPRE_07595 [Limisphaerales bacterium]